ncbi:carcinoembryonic antigen-related cell adhesion molecule 1 isoform X5 [Paramuricea clavata]|uniref:Carcinoembryonic antigen-related cell adhesion molecule 1 isoform X5 n=1 Tax=Paramuricea clavata TaxID=317549 RepID=A0A6S7JPL3_PARCT|nr:carcinoembryonic antigen-related cell adhesion molecule 1 isoform X5 [Paramuricea clavata]
MRDVDSSSETYFSYNKTRVSRERQVDLVVNSMTLADSGVYRCKFRKPDEGWSIRVDYNVIVEEKGVISPIDLPPEIVYITRGDTLKLQSDLPDVTASSYGKNYETFWDFSPSLTTTTQEEAVRLIDSMDSSVESLDVRASLKENGTTLVLTNTTFNDSGVYHLRILGPLSTTAVHKDFNVIVEDKAIASIHCPRIVRLTEGENFFCLCEDISTSEVTAQAAWLVDGQTFKHSRPFHEEELYLNNVTAADAGFYTCRVRTVTMVDDITLEVLVLHVEQEMKGNKPSMQKYPDWYYLAGSLGVGLLLGMALVLMIVSIRRKSRKTKGVYEDVRASPDLELDITAQYQDMSRQPNLYQETDAESTSPYEIADLTCPIYMDMNEARKQNQAGCSHQNETAPVPGYTDLEYRDRVDSHPYQGLEQYRLPGNRV